MRTIILSLLGIALAALCVFFAYYTVRLMYINLTGVVTHRQAGMYIGFVAFPIATVVFGWLSLRCLRAAGRRN